MKTETKTAIAALVALLHASMAEVRERCADTTHAKLVSAVGDVEVALAAEGDGDGVDAGKAVDAAHKMATALSEMDVFAITADVVERLGNVLGDRLALEVRAALDEAKAT